jgi:hypothetical protein
VSRKVTITTPISVGITVTSRLPRVANIVRP